MEEQNTIVFDHVEKIYQKNNANCNNKLDTPW